MFSELRTKRALALTCRSFNALVAEFLFDSIPLINVPGAERIAETLESSVVYSNPGKWVRHISLVGVFFSPPATNTSE